MLRKSKREGLLGDWTPSTTSNHYEKTKLENSQMHQQTHNNHYTTQRWKFSKAALASTLHDPENRLFKNINKVSLLKDIFKFIIIAVTPKIHPHITKESSNT